MANTWISGWQSAECGGAHRGAGGVLAALVIAAAGVVQEGRAQAGWRWVQANAATAGKCFNDPISDRLMAPSAAYVSAIFYGWPRNWYWHEYIQGSLYKTFDPAAGQWSGDFSEGIWCIAPYGPQFGGGGSFVGWYWGLSRFYFDHGANAPACLAWDYGDVTVAGQPPAAFNLAMRKKVWDGSSFVTASLHAIPQDDIDGFMFQSTTGSPTLVSKAGGWFLSWDGIGGWIQLQPLVVPPIYDGTKLIHDTARNRLVMLILNTPQATIWEYDVAANMWFERINMVPANFTRRDQYSLGFHPPTGNIVIYGGAEASGNILGDTWHYNGTSFYQAMVGASPARRAGAHMAYRSATQELMMWGGTNGAGLADTWAYTPGTATVAYNYYGTGCPGSAGTPYLDLNPGTLPFSGQRFSALIKQVPFFAPTFMMIGNSDQNHLGLPLPYSLTSLGMPGCDLLTGPDGVYPCTNIFGTALWDVQLPPGLGGQSFFNQAVIFDASANAMGVSLSNGAQAIVGY